MLNLIVLCNNCASEKRETNHWWLITKEGPSMTIEPLGDVSYPQDAGKIHLCSESCVIAFTSRFMNSTKSLIIDETVNNMTMELESLLEEDDSKPFPFSND